MPASVLGKRKARSAQTQASAVAPTDNNPERDAQDAHTIFQRYFEAQFKPLQDEAPLVQQTKAEVLIEDMNTGSEDEDEDNDDDDDDDAASDCDAWSGISGEDDATTDSNIEVVSHIDPSSTSSLSTSLSNNLSAKKVRKALLSSKVPSAVAAESSATTEPASKKPKTTTEEDAPTLLKNDLELQRLLTESHLFNTSKVGTLSNAAVHHRPHDGSIEHAGRNRLLATDLRMAALGSKTSIYAQAKMPMSHRKGINAAAMSREDKRRREARENGIILERPSGNTDALKAYTRAAGVVKNKNSRTAQGASRKSGPRDIDAPAVGRLRDGMLKLSKKDIHDIQSSGNRRSAGKGRKGKRR